MILLLKEKANRGAVNGMMVLTDSPASVEMLGYAGFDYVIIDTEHGANDIAEVEAMVRAAEVSGTTPLVRVTRNDPAYILRAMDVGARGILVPQVNSAAEADRAVRAVKYCPRGDRGLAGIVRAARYGFQPLDKYIAESNAHSLVIVQVEDIKAVGALDEILAVDGVDGVFVGPADLSHSMAMPGKFDDPEFIRIMHAIVARTVKSGKIAGMFCFDAEQARYWRGLGVRMLCVGTDTMLFAGAARTMARELKGN